MAAAGQIGPQGYLAPGAFDVLAVLPRAPDLQRDLAAARGALADLRSRGIAPDPTTCAGKAALVAAKPY